MCYEAGLYLCRIYMLRTFAYILLFIHFNTTLFIPVVDEKDIFDAYGRQINDINSTIDFIDQVVLGHNHINTEDEDDDQAHYFAFSTVSYYLSAQQQINCTKEEPSTEDLAIAYPLMAVQKPMQMAYDILTPPPRTS